MSNTLVTTDLVAKEAIKIAHEKATFLSTINREYDPSFNGTGGKHGSTLRIRQPNQYWRRTGSRVMDVQDQNEATTTLTVATQDGVDMRFNGSELKLSIEEFSKRYLEPAMAVLISGIEGDVIAALTKKVYNVTGTAGTVVGAVSSGYSDTTAIGNARAKLNQGLAPGGDRSCQFDSVTMASVANGMKHMFLPAEQVGKAFTEGYIARTAMADFYENERTYVHAGGSDHTSVTTASDATVVDGTSALSIASGGGVMTAGDVFTVAGVYACHPETKAAYSHLQQFVVLTGTNGALTVSPTIYLGNSDATRAKQNVCSAAGAKLAATDFNSKTVTAIGGDSAVLRQNLMYHKDFATFVTADLPIMADASKCVVRNYDGIALRVWEGSDIRNDERLMRLDILYGYEVLTPAWACRITN